MVTVAEARALAVRAKAEVRVVRTLVAAMIRMVAASAPVSARVLRGDGMEGVARASVAKGRVVGAVVRGLVEVATAWVAVVRELVLVVRRDEEDVMA